MIPGAPWQAARDCGDWDGDGARYSPRVVYDCNGHKLATFYCRDVVGMGGDAPPGARRSERNACAYRAALAAMAPELAAAVVALVEHRRREYLDMGSAPYLELATLAERLARLKVEWPS